MTILFSILSIILGFVGLVFSADKFVLGASTTARNLGVSPLIIGLTIVAFGTSAPEMFTSIEAAFKGVPELAVGNALGSNIANIGLVLAVTALVCPIVIPLSLLKQELPFLLIVTFSVLLVFYDKLLNWFDGVILLMILAFFVYRLIISKTKITEGQPVEVDADVAEFIAPISTSKALGLTLLGLIFLVISSKFLVYGASNIALALGVSEIVIGLTIVAIGTSLPELAASVTSALKGHHELAVGNIVGSNIFNILLVLPIPAFLSPIVIEPIWLWRDYGTMCLLTVLLALAILIQVKRQQKLGRLLGAVLLLMYLSYTGVLFVTQ